MSEFIPRLIAPVIEEAHRYFPVIVVTGPRQSGKTCLCKHLYPEYKYINLEDITTRAAALDDPTAFLDSLGQNAIIDEVQNVPDLLSQIQVRVDEDKSRRYILTGSSNFQLMQSITQSLAGRSALFTLLPLSLSEVRQWADSTSTDAILTSGLYPGVIADKIPPYLFYRNYYNTYVERDLRNLLNVRNILAFNTFIRLVASRVGSEFNASSLARETRVTSVTIAEWMSLLSASYIAFMLPPYFANISKSLTKMRKIYFYDTGLLCFLLGIENADQLATHPLRGAVFENLAIVELLKSRYNKGLEPNLYFYRETTGQEVDAVLSDGSGLSLFEIKAGATFRTDYSRNMRQLATSMDHVKQSTVIYDGQSIPPVAVNVRDI